MTAPTRIDTVLVANRGEIARRIIRTCRRLGIATVAVYSDADAEAPHVREADLAVRLPGTAPADTYLRIDVLVAAALDSGADAVHPGYGFLSERAEFAEAVTAAGLLFVGPPATAIASMGSKIEAKRRMRSAGVPVLPDTTVDTLDTIGLPALVKASAGGGGRGMRIVRERADLDEAMAHAAREAGAAFGNDAVFVERYVEGGRHVEVQVFADTFGTTISLFERDCTLQRRHQKVLEETPSPALDEALRGDMCAAAVAAARSVGYVGAGTVEFLLAPDRSFAFLEMNTRLQVEHTVTEMVTGLDLVELQLRVAAGEPLPPHLIRATASGHAIEVRLCAEDPAQHYRPSSGTVHVLEFAEIEGVRVDSGVVSGSTVSPHYDSMIAKLAAHGETRAVAARRLSRALEQMTLIGVTTNRHQLLSLTSSLLDIDDPRAGRGVDTGWLDRSDPPDAPPATTDDVAVVALAVIAERAAQLGALRHLPSGWRNNPSTAPTMRLGEHTVSWRHQRDGAVAAMTVDGLDVDVRRADVTLARRPPVIHDGIAYLHGGRVCLAIHERFVEPDLAGHAGSLVAPMPGTVLRVLVAVGDPVHAGQPMLTVEAMKMEHQIVAPADGVVGEVCVTTGEQLTTGQTLIRLTDPT